MERFCPKQLQSEHREWAAVHFPGQPPLLPAGGMVEEAGEVMHAVIKLYQLSLFPNSQRYTVVGVTASLVDAIGDSAIFACSFCNAAKWDYSIAVSGHTPAPCSAVEAAAALVVHAASIVSGKNDQVLHLRAYMARLRQLAEMHELDFGECIAATWKGVKSRRT